ncbi:DNA gyrase inhibitor YacG [Bdellovibrio bacteriovorus]|uniref:DNA gyrase inhibitor YacG n=1 Tax=Bdellovibrio bacteriovorus TaxID=959 RepID=UPI00059F247A|nr:DNA gyrase inhibitor YacG [Bdellovibrio bacteriovorus]
MTESQSRQVKCPQCGLLALYSSENPFRPFCSERCRLIDLGEWASESYRIPVKDSSSDALTSMDDDDYPGEDKH